MSASLNAYLRELVADLSAELPEVAEKRMFGSQAFFANSNIYALVWDGRVCVKLPDPSLFERAMALDGSMPFDPSGQQKKMGTWVVLSESLHDEVDALRTWVEHAHRLAMMRPPKKKAKTPKTLEKSRTKAPANRVAKRPSRR